MVSTRTQTHTVALSIKCSKAGYNVRCMVSVNLLTNNDQTLFSSGDGHVHLVWISYKPQCVTQPLPIWLNQVRITYLTERL